MSEDRDRLFERALARRFRAHGAAEPSCLDPETLAAYHERMLSPDEMSSAKSHIVSCLRCQEILTQLEATEKISARVEVEEEAPAVILAATRVPGGARRLLSDVARDVPPREAPEAMVALPRKKAFAFRWAAPAGAIAAALLVWIGVRQAGVLRKPSSEATAVAERHRQLPATPPGPEPGPIALPQEEKQKAPSGSAGYLNEETPMTKGAAAPQPSLRDETKDAPPKLEREKKSPDELAYSVRREGATGARGPSAAAAQAQANNALQRGDQGAVAGAAQAVEPIPESDKKAPLPPGRAESDALVAAKPAPLPPPPASPASRVGNLPSAGKNESGLKSNADVDMALRAVSKTSLDVRIASPGGRTMWSFGANGRIFHSTDAGRTWLPQISGVAADLTGGSAPSEKVCWIAGAAGTVLRTTDGGLHWQQIVTPVRADLGGIHALDAKRASIWDAPNRASYQTSDGGKTWKLSASE